MGEIPFEKSVSARIFHNMKKNKIPAVQAGILHGYTDIYALSRITFQQKKMTALLPKSVIF